MINKILKAANELIALHISLGADSGWANMTNEARAVHALKTACNRTLMSIAFEFVTKAGNNQYEVTTFDNGNHLVSLENGAWVTGWI